MSSIREYTIKELMDNALQDGYFMRLDVIINYIGIEAYYGKNEWDLYEKYEVTSGRKFEPSRDKFIKLIKSFEENGCLSKQYPLMIATKNFLHVRNGAHRLACALYFGNEYIYGYIRNPARLTDAGYKLLKKRGFTEAELKVLEDKKDEILKKVEVQNG